MHRLPQCLLFLTLFVLCVFGSCGDSVPKPMLNTQGQAIVNGSGDTVLLRGIGLGGWMLQEGYMYHLGHLGQQYRIRQAIEDLVGPDATADFYQRWLENHTRRADIDSLAAWGFNAIRLPMHYNLYTLPVAEEPVPGEHTWLEEGFRWTDSLLSWCQANQMYLILDLHAAPGGQGHDLHISDRNPDQPSLWESQANRDKTVALWRKLAERYAHEPWIGGYDLLNETNWGFEDPEDRLGVRERGNVPLRQLLVDITQAIREVDTNHIIFVEGNGFANNFHGLLPAWDNKLVLSFHKYGNPNTPASIRYFLDLREKYNIPLWMGEAGENSNTWFTEAVALLEAHGIGWAWWPNKKMGINNPLEIRQPTRYQMLVDHWSGAGPKPDPAVAQKILDEWIENLRLENNVIHRGVIDALFRQVSDHTALPYAHHVIRRGTRLAAVHYDLGRQRVAYYDTDTASYRFTEGVDTEGNRGRQYRNDGVDIEKDAAGYHVFHIEDGEWLQYTIDVQEAGINTLKLQVGSPAGRGQVSVRIGNHTLTNPVAIPHTGSDTEWTYVFAQVPALELGTNVIRIHAEQGGFTFKSIVFE